MELLLALVINLKSGSVMHVPISILYRGLQIGNLSYQGFQVRMVWYDEAIQNLMHIVCVCVGVLSLFNQLVLSSVGLEDPWAHLMAFGVLLP